MDDGSTRLPLSISCVGQLIRRLYQEGASLPIVVFERPAVVGTPTLRTATVRAGRSQNSRILTLAKDRSFSRNTFHFAKATSALMVLRCLRTAKVPCSDNPPTYNVR